MQHYSLKQGNSVYLPGNSTEFLIKASNIKYNGSKNSLLTSVNKHPQQYNWLRIFFRVDHLNTNFLGQVFRDYWLCFSITSNLCYWPRFSYNGWKVHCTVKSPCCQSQHLDPCPGSVIISMTTDKELHPSGPQFLSQI